MKSNFSHTTKLKLTIFHRFAAKKDLLQNYIIFTVKCQFAFAKMLLYLLSNLFSFIFSALDSFEVVRSHWVSISQN